MHAAGLMAVRAAVVVLLGHPVFRALGRHSPGEWYLQAIAVVPQARGGGVGHALLMDAIAKAAVEGCDSVALDVNAANVRAQTLYERLGLRVASTSRSAVLLGGVRVHRMSAQLDSVRVHAVGQAHQADAQKVEST
jgi:ribosomal protein S18 acetylase RimI-like enzyme